jgi:DNA polymerase-1
MIALIDGDIVCYQAAFGAETYTDWGDEDDTITISGSKAETRAAIDNLINEIKFSTNTDEVLMVFSDKKNFRKDVYKLYKSNRKGNRKPVTYQYGVDYVESNYVTMRRTGLEADDCLGILATGDISGFRADKVVCSIDKDMRSFPCKLFNWKHPELGVQNISEAEADLTFYTQCLTGDSVDGYPGCPGIGPVRAAKLLVGVQRETAWGMIVAAYEQKKLTEEDALVQARVARILRSEDYDFTKKKPILWTPTKGEEDADIVSVQSEGAEDGQG